MPRGSALSYATWLLSKRGYTVAILREKLSQKYPTQECDAAVKKLIEIGLLNDEHYAREYARSKTVYAHRGKYRVKLELLKKKVPKNIIDSALGEISDDDELNSAIELVAQKQKSLDRVSPEIKQRRLYSLLARRGFSLETIKKILKK